MTPYASDHGAQQRVTDKAAILSGQLLPETSSASTRNSDMVVIEGWAREVKEIFEIWQSYLFGDRDDPISLIEISGLKLSLQSLRQGLVVYLFEDTAKLRYCEPGAWTGIQKHWILIQFNLASLWDEVVYYRDWMAEIDKRDDQITNPMSMRKMRRQMRDDMRTIVGLFATLADALTPIIVEVLELSSGPR